MSNNSTYVYETYIRAPAEGSVVQPEISKGWPWILSSLKSLLETGEALPPAVA